MVAYGRKVTGFTPVERCFETLDLRKIDYDDVANRADQTKSDFDKLIAFKKN